MNYDDHFSHVAINSTEPPQGSSLEDQGFSADDYKDETGVDRFSDQEIELLQGLWDMMVICVDIGRRVDIMQIICPELFENIASSPTTLSPNPVNDNTKGTDETQFKTKGSQG